MDINELAENLGLEKEEYIELVELLIETSKADIAAAETAFREQDSDGAANAFHSIKGAAGNLGLTEIFEIAKQGEMTARGQDMNQLPGAVQLLKDKLASLSELSDT